MNHQGSVFRRHASWHYRLYVTERGARTRKTRGGFKTKGEARAALEIELQNDRLGPQLARELYPEAITLDQLVASYVNQHPLQASSKKTLAERLCYARDRWGDTDIRHITVVEVKAWRAGLPKGSAQGIHQALKQTLRFAVDAGLLVENPASKVTNPAARREEIKPFGSWQEIDALAQELDPRHRAIPILVAGTGLRPQEWIALERSDIERGESPVVHVRRTFTNGVLKRYGKTERSLRRVPLRGVVLKALEAMPTRMDTPLLFPGAGGGYSTCGTSGIANGNQRSGLWASRARRSIPCAIRTPAGASVREKVSLRWLGSWERA